MRFQRRRRYGPYEDTRRKRLALQRRNRLRREALPLFAELTREAEIPEDVEMAQRAIDWSAWQQRNRDTHAAEWRRARARLAAYGDNARAMLRRAWNLAPYPGDPVYLLGMLHDWDAGRLHLWSDGRLHYAPEAEERALRARAAMLRDGVHA